jgi:putative hydrolase of the HAD superfamily
MVEDSADNLKTAKRLGMKTVLVTEAARAPAHVDVNITSLAQLPRLLACFR